MMNPIFLILLITLYTFTFQVFVTGQAFSNQAHDILLKMSDEERNVTLAKFLKGSNEQCDVVVKNFYQGSTKEGNAFWNVACRDKKSYVIMIYNDSVGSTKILECSVLKVIAGVECFTKF